VTTTDFPFREALVRDMLWPEQRSVLRACLLEGQAGRDAWHDLTTAGGGDLKGIFRDLPSPFKGLLPLLCAAARRCGAELADRDRTYLNTAYAREEQRIAAYSRISRAVLQRLEPLPRGPLVVDGSALAETLYEVPFERHSHDIHLLFADREDLAAALMALQQDGLGAGEATPEERIASIRLPHPSGLSVVLSRRLFESVLYSLPPADLWTHAERHVIDGVPARILSPSDTLLYLCGRLQTSGTAPNPLWICDAWRLIRRRRDLDWSRLVSDADRAALALPLATLLCYLRDDLELDVPVEPVERLARLGRGGRARDAYFVSVRGGSGRAAVALLRHFRRPGEGLAALRHLLFPSAWMLQAVYGATTPAQRCRLYALRPLRFVAARLRRAR
jgi:hypothetical protein